MSLIKSISGIRGTIGGKQGENLTPFDIVKFTSAYARLIYSQTGNKKIVIGRDARLSGDMLSRLVSGTLLSMGMDVIDLGLSTTPTVEIAVPLEKAGGGIILTASHNPKQWNALKLLNFKGEFISAAEGESVLQMGEETDFAFADVDSLGTYTAKDGYIQKHIDMILALPLVNKEAIANAGFSVAVDAVNSTGGIAIPQLLKALGVKDIHTLYCEPTGHFPHNPEPLPEHLTDIAALMKEKKADVGIVVDPDVDRLAMVCDDGSMFGEEYTLVSIADYVLKHTPGNTVSNLSSTRALRDVTEKHGMKYEAAAVGEVNVVQKMKDINAVIGGEGNGGIIYPELHYGRDALVGVALLLSHMAETGLRSSALRKSYPNYFISKNKIDVDPKTDLSQLFEKIKLKYSQQPINDIDGLKIEFDMEWVQLRRSNTEPIVRIYAESKDEQSANALASRIIEDIKSFL